MRKRKLQLNSDLFILGDKKYRMLPGDRLVYKDTDGVRCTAEIVKVKTGRVICKLPSGNEILVRRNKVEGFIPAPGHEPEGDVIEIKSKTENEKKSKNGKKQQ